MCACVFVESREQERGLGGQRDLDVGDPAEFSTALVSP